MDQEEEKELERLVETRVRRLNAMVLAITAGVICGLLLFGATIILVIKHSLVEKNQPVGPHLKLLGEYFPWYSVSVQGSAIGFLYGFFTGWLIVYVGALVYNFVADLRHPKK